MHTYEIERQGITVLALGPADAKQRGLINWSLRPVQNQSDAYKERDLTRELSLQLSGMRVQKAYAPHVAPASAHIADATEMKDKIRLGAVDLFRNSGLPADGIFLEPGEAFVMSAAGCPFITATDRSGKHLVVAHAGRDSLIEREAVLGERVRKHVSVVYAIIDAFKERAIPAKELEMYMHFSISTNAFEHDFDHPNYGRYNRQLGKFVEEHWPGCTEPGEGSVFLNLEYLFMSQAAQAHVCSLQAIERLDQHPNLAHTRDGMDSKRRNLFIVKRTV